MASLHGQVEDLLRQVETTLETASAEEPTTETIGRLDGLQVKLEEAVKDYLDKNGILLDFLREKVREIEEKKHKAAMSEKQTGPKRNEARVQELSEELTRELRLERVDGAIKELLEFLSDAHFFAANASTGRRRRLRSLQNAIEKALQK